MFVSEAVKNYIISIVSNLRNSPDVKTPPSTRGSIALHKGARALAFLDGRDHVIPDDVKFLCPYVLGHRIFLKPESLSDGATPDQLIASTCKEFL